jgi:uncharacterized protein (DUF697 family)
MATDVPALPRSEDSGSPFVRWLEQFRDRINLGMIDSHAAKPIRLLVTGTGADELIDVLDPDGSARSAVFDHLETAPGWSIADSATRAILVCPDAGVVDRPVPEHLESSALPVFLIDRPFGDDEHPAITTHAVPHRPSPGQPARYRVSELTLAQLRRHVLPDVVEACRGLEVSLGAQVPAFRPTVAAKLSVDCAMNSLKVAGASALVDHVPVLGLVLGSIASAGDTIAITGMQVAMLLNLAAAYGKKAEMARVIELLPVIGGGYGWRALARELSGFIPIAGPVIKAGIAYAGSLVIGQAATFYYETGDRMAPDKMSALYREAIDRARTLAKELVDKLKKKPDNQTP